MIKRLFAKLAILSLLVSLPFVGITNATWQDEVHVGGTEVNSTCWEAPSVPVLTSPANNTYAGVNSPWTLNPVMDWEDSTSTCPSANIQYHYQSSHVSDFSTLAYNSGWLNDSQIPAPGTPEGIYYWRVQAQDQYGNESDWSEPWLLIVDRTYPIVQITNPEDGDIVSGTVDIRGWVHDENLSHYNISVYPGDADVWDFSKRLVQQTVYGPEFDEKSLLSWDTTAFPDGEYQIRLAARDLAGNRDPMANSGTGISMHVIRVTVSNSPVVTIDPAFTQIVNGYACGIGNALANDGLRATVENWHPEYKLQGRYKIGNNPNYSGWFDFVTGGVFGQGTLTEDLVNHTAEFIVYNTGDSPEGLAGWQVKVLDAQNNPIGNQDSLDYLITTDPMSLVCGGTMQMGYETAETGSLPGVGICPVTTADDSIGGASLQILKWNSISFATKYRIQGYKLQGSSWVPYGSQYVRYVLPTPSPGITVSSDVVTYTAKATYEVTTAYFIEALDDSNNVLAKTQPESSNFTCTFTVDRSTSDFGIGSSVVINEFLPNPTGDDDATQPNGEWVELYNKSTLPIDVSGWHLYDSLDAHPLTISSSITNTGYTTVAPHGFLVVYLDGAYTNGWLNNGSEGDTVRLFDGPVSTGNLIDSYTYSGAFPENKSFARIPDGSSNWVDPIPTPGMPNRLEDDGKQALTTDVVLELRDDKKAVSFEVSGAEPYDLLEYEISYEPENREPQGITGTITLEDENEITRDYFMLGTDSSGDWVYDTGMDKIYLIIRLTGNNIPDRTLETELDY